MCSLVLVYIATLTKWLEGTKLLREYFDYAKNDSIMFNYVDNAESGTGLLKMGSVVIPFDIRMSKESEIYEIVNTDGGSYAV